MPEIPRPDLAGAEIFDLTPLGEAHMPGENPVDHDIQGLITRSVEEAVQHFEEHIEPDMAQATDYYYGRPFGDERTGRSKVVSTDLRDATLDQIPDLLEIYMGSDSVVQFKPRFDEDRPVAEQATDYVNYIFFEDNDGFLILNSVFKDAGVRRLGYVKWWWQEQDRIKGTTMTGLSENELIFLGEQEGVEYEIVGERQDILQSQDPQTGEVISEPGTVYDIEVTRTITEGRVRVEEVPPEEIVWTPEARKFDRAPTVAHRREVPKDELILMGIDEAFIEEHMGHEQDLSTENLAWSRQFYGSSTSDILGDLSMDPSQERVLFTEVYALVDTDGDGVGELRMFQCIGNQYAIVPDENGDIFGELVDEIPIALFTPDPEPHTIPGLCNFDYLKEVQRVKSQIQRSQLNSLAQSVDNQMVVAQNEVNIRDLINPEISGIIRVRRDVNNSIREIKHSFVGQDTMPVLAYYDQIKADRTGNAGPREGLDPNILQSTTSEAVSSTLSKAQKRIVMLARVYAETGFKSLFQGIYRTVVKHQQRARLVQLRSEYVQVDPRAWDAEMDVRVNVALGTGSRQEKIQGIQALIAEQKEHLAMGSPLVSFAELRMSYGKLADLLGYKDTAQFWKEWGPEQQAQFEQQQAEAAENAPPDPAVAITQVEELKVQTDAANKIRTNDLKELEIMLQDERERDKNAREFALKEYELELKYGSEIDDRMLKAKIEAAKLAASKNSPAV